MERLLIFPCSGNGIEALDCAREQYEILGFIDDDPQKKGTQYFGLEVFGRDILQEIPAAQVLAVPGSPTSYLQRKSIIDGLGVASERFATVIHPKASVASEAQIGHNVLIMAGVIITSNAILGNHLCVLPNTVIHHDVQIDAYTLLGANITVAGHSHIGRNCYIGSGTRIMNNLQIGDSVLIRMGTNVIRNIAARKKVVGNPARILGEVA
jgi:sugar O-acyltransferase (sialic acid O-acetyltransferase NeuD family)